MANLVQISGIINGEIKEFPVARNRKETKIIFRLAVRRRYQEQGRYLSDFIRCEVYIPHIRDYIKNYYKPKHLILLSGELRVKTWQRQDGTWEQTYAVYVDKAQLGFQIIYDKEEAEVDDNVDAEIDW